MLKNLVAAAPLLAALAVAACAADGPDDSTGADDQDITVGSVQSSFVGSYVDKGQSSQDFGALALKADETYAARVLASVARTNLVCNRAPCNDSESGTWSISRSSDGIDRLRLKPQASPVRIYVVSRPIVMCIVAPCPSDPTGIRLERRTSSQVLRQDASAQPTSPAPYDGAKPEVPPVTPAPVSPQFCKAGTLKTAPGFIASSDGKECSVPSVHCLTKDSNACPMLSPLPPDFCKGGTVKSEPRFIAASDGLECEIPSVHCLTKDSNACPMLSPLAPDFCKGGTIKSEPRFIAASDGKECEMPSIHCLTADQNACPLF